MNNTPKYLGTLVARLIVRGDVRSARLAAGGRKRWNVPEARAIAGACRYARDTWGADVSLAQFL